MSLIKKIDVEKHFAARRAMRLGRIGPASQPGAAGIKSAAKRKRRSCPCRSSHLGTFFSERILRLDSDHVRFWPEPVAQTAGKPATVKINTIFLRDGCILPSQFDSASGAVFQGMGRGDRDRGNGAGRAIRSVGWHFMWLADSYSSQALGRTAETAIHRALARTFLR